MSNNNANDANIFLTKRRLIFFGVSFLVFIGLMIFALIGILNIDFISLFKNIGNELGKGNITILFFILVFIFPVIKVVQTAIIYYWFCKNNKISVKFREAIYITLVYMFVLSITPSSLGGEPILIYWFRKKGATMQQAAAMVLINSTMGQAMGMLITWPSYIYLLTMYGSFIGTESGPFIFWFSTVGMSMDVIVLIGLIVTSMSSHAHYFFSLIFNWFLKFLKFKYKSADQIKNDLRNKKEFLIALKKEYRSYKIVIYICLSYFFMHALLYTQMYFSISLVFDYGQLNYSDIFNFTNIATTANNFIPLPGSEGSLQILLQAMLNLDTNIEKIYINEGIFIWRFSSSYLINMITFVILIPATIKFVKKWNKNRKL